MEEKEKPSKETLDQNNLNKLLKEEAEKLVRHELKQLVRQKTGTFTQRSGIKLIKWVFTLIGIFGVALLFIWYFGKADVKEVQQLAETLILNVLLPVLTLLLGYIFGSRGDLDRN